MALATEKIETVEVQDDLKSLQHDVESELGDLVEKIRQETEVLLKEPALHEAKDIDAMMKRKLLLESEIEATMETELEFLPSSKKMLVRLAREEAELTAADTERTLNFYKLKREKLLEERKMYNQMVDKATKVNNKLDSLLMDRSESALFEILKRRYDQVGILFRELRTVLHMILTEFYPEESEGLSMESLLEALVTKLIEDPSDPYLTIHDGMMDYHISFLLRANLIMRHKDDITRIRFIDPN